MNTIKVETTADEATSRVIPAFRLLLGKSNGDHHAIG